MKVRCMSYDVQLQERYTCSYFGIKYLCIFPLVILVYNLVKHLKFNNMRFMNFLVVYDFMQVG
jgi:hypothetical protein